MCRSPVGRASVFSVKTFFLSFSSAACFFFLSSSFKREVYSFTVSSLVPVIRLLCFFEAAASSDGGARMSAKRIYNWGRNWCRGGSGMFRQSCTTTTILRAPGRNCRRGGDSREGTDTVFHSCV